jgi:mRNA interferase RelE/StbE
MWSASLAYSVEFDPAALKDLKKLDRPVQQRLVGFLRTRVATLDNPRELGEALAGATLGNYWKYRVGDWRIVCDIQDTRIVVRVLRIVNRREVYR